MFKIPPETKPACWGAVGGAVALAIVGFVWGGWVTGGTAEARASERAKTAVISALVPICVDKFTKQADAAAKLEELKKASSWERGTLIEKAGWAKTPGSKDTDSAVASACAEVLVAKA